MPVSEAGWYPDPFRRFDYRYFDGDTWTDRVSTGGSITADPPFEGPTPALRPAGGGWAGPPQPPPTVQGTRLAVWVVVGVVGGAVVLVLGVAVIAAIALVRGDSGGSDAGGREDERGSEVADDEPADVGATVYTQFCAQCHGSSGEGGVGPSLDDPSTLADTDELIELVEDGRTAMPAFGETLSQEEIDAVVEYVQEDLR